MGVETDVQVSERLQQITVSSEWQGRYRSAVQVRDLPPIYLDEPRELGGTNAGPTPLETVLSALVSCSAMIGHIMKSEMGFQLDGLTFTATGVHDVRRSEMRRTGKKYSEVEPIAKHLHSVRVEARLVTSEPDDRVETFTREIERLCPLINLLRDASVPLQIDWVRAPAAP